MRGLLHPGDCQRHQLRQLTGACVDRLRLSGARTRRGRQFRPVLRHRTRHDTGGVAGPTITLTARVPPQCSAAAHRRSPGTRSTPPPAPPSTAGWRASQRHGVDRRVDRDDAVLADLRRGRWIHHRDYGHGHGATRYHATRRARHACSPRQQCSAGQSGWGAATDDVAVTGYELERCAGGLHHVRAAGERQLASSTPR